MREKKYEFRRRLEITHKPNRCNTNELPSVLELQIDKHWRIMFRDGAAPLIQHVAKDLQDYLFESMNVSVTLHKMQDIAAASRDEEKAIILAEKQDLPEIGMLLHTTRSYRVMAEEKRIIVCGNEDRGVGQGSYYLEDLMNLRESPILKLQDVIREPIFSPRMAHSGWGLDRYPDEHLNAMAHAGIDAILIFVKDVDRTPEGYQDFNYLVDRAALYGLDVYVYSYLFSSKHPEAPDAENDYESTYGKIFKACPRFKGVILVGESCEFPSKDPKTTGVLRSDWPADQPQTKPSPGWWPCEDYPQWLNLLKKVIRKHNSEAELVFWTYNWGWAPEEDRLRLIRNLPEDMTLMVTFEMFEQIKHENVTNVGVDYSLSFVGPGQYFRSEAEAAHEKGIKLYTMSNTGGLTWDIGVIPYEPMPYQWARRHKALLQAQKDWGLSGLMESHHYGWWPSFISDLAKAAYWTPSPPPEEMLAAIAKRDFSSEAGPLVLEAWRYWSEGIRHYIPTDEDQYGPFRVGPSYPMVFRRGVQMQASWHAMFGNQIVLTNYSPGEGSRQSLGISRVDVEIRSLQRMLDCMQQGNACLENAIRLTPDHKQEDGMRMLGLGRFIANAVKTTIHIKQWWKLKMRLFNEPQVTAAHEILCEMERLAELEIANSEDTIPLVDADSRLGWEPSMDYMTDSDHIRWKINQVRSVLENEFSDYRKSLALTDE